MGTGAQGCALMVVPTYNEAGNIERVVGRLLAAVPDLDVLVVDDGSPDGTGDIADRIATSEARVHVLHRSAKEGLGRAYIAGFSWAAQQGYEVVGEIDADGSHLPEQLPSLFEALTDADLVIGSRYVRGGRVVNWTAGRKALSRGGNVYVKLLLGMTIADATAGYRLFRMSAIKTIDVATVNATGYVFQVEMTYRAITAGLRVVEVPITFEDRTTGHSKMTPDVASESLRLITRWGLTERLERARARHRGA